MFRTDDGRRQSASSSTPASESAPTHRPGALAPMRAGWEMTAEGLRRVSLEWSMTTVHERRRALLAHLLRQNCTLACVHGGRTPPGPRFRGPRTVVEHHPDLASEARVVWSATTPFALERSSGGIVGE